MKATAAIGFTLSGLGLLIWPWLTFFGLLANPFKSPVKLAVWLPLAAYPVVWGVCLLLGIRSLSFKDQTHRRPWIYVLIPYAVVGWVLMGSLILSS